MTDDLAEIVVVLAYRIGWFLGQGISFFVLWNWFVVDIFMLPQLGLLGALGLFAFARLAISPPKLDVSP
tara:strand:- start:4430 stop:4636 length:207 start_codon:yes stop_codon:yes gene_type:complete